MFSPILAVLLMTAPASDPVALTVKDRPLLDEIESRLAAGDKIIQRNEGRPMSVTDKKFYTQFSLGTLARNIKPAFPDSLPGIVPLLTDDNPRVRCASLLILQSWLNQKRFLYQPLPDYVLTESEWAKLRLAIISNIANPKLKDASMFAGEQAVALFPRLAKTPLNETEEKVLLQKLESKDATNYRQIIQTFLSVEPVTFPKALQAPLREVLKSKRERGRMLLILQGLRKAPSELQVVLREILKREPYAWHASTFAMLLRRSGVYDPNMVPALVRMASRKIPARTRGMMGRGGMSIYVGGGSQNNGPSIASQKQLASSTLKIWPTDQPQVVPELMKLLDAEDYTARETGVWALWRFRSRALIAVPKLLMMNQCDDRPQGRFQIIGRGAGLEPLVKITVASISAQTISELHTRGSLPLLVSNTQAFLGYLRQMRPTQ